MSCMSGNAAQPPPARRPFRPAKPVVIGLTGGVAAGKSTVARLFGDHGFAHVDADSHARAVAADPDAIAAVRATFGDGVVTADGLDRKALADLVFADTAARRRLDRHAAAGSG
jgi:dephospho-CoA kinase